MRLAVATAVISGATLGSQTFKSDGPTFDQSSSIVTPAFSPSSLALPDQSSFVAHNTAASTAVSVVAHSTLSNMSGSGASAASGASSASSMGSYSGGGSAAGIRVTTPSSAGGGGGSSAGGNGGGSSVGSSMGAASLAMATSSFAASAMRAPAGPGKTPAIADAFPSPLTDVYSGDAPGVITGIENYNLDNMLIDNYGQPIGDAVLPLMILAMLFGWYVGRRKKLKEVRGR